MTIWTAKLSDNTTVSGQTDNGSWYHLAESLSPRAIKELCLDNEIGVGRIDKNADGYFIANKIIATFPSSSCVNLVGIGYWKNNDDKVRIKWFNTVDMTLTYTEAKYENECGPCLIKNS